MKKIGRQRRFYTIDFCGKRHKRIGPKTYPKLHWMVSLLKQYAEEAYDISVTLQKIAAMYHKNEKYLDRLFQKEMGMGWNGMNKAEQRLCQSNYKIIDIAMECGFISISYFNRLFREKFGMSPSAYRKRQKKTE